MWNGQFAIRIFDIFDVALFIEWQNILWYIIELVCLSSQSALINVKITDMANQIKGGLLCTDFEYEYWLQFFMMKNWIEFWIAKN